MRLRVEHIGAAAATFIFVGVFCMALREHGRRDAMVKSGLCKAVTEQLYTPPPSSHTSCYGDEKYRHCNTYFTQSDPYLRTLWRCPEPDTLGESTEFWRRTSKNVPGTDVKHTDIGLNGARVPVPTRQAHLRPTAQRREDKC